MCDQGPESKTAKAKASTAKAKAKAKAKEVVDSEFANLIGETFELKHP